jgi:hypothetical protein
MERIIYSSLVMICLLLPTTILAQAPVKILTGQTDNQVREYFSSLKEFFTSNRNVGIEQKTSDDGDLILKFGTPTLNEEITSSLEIIARFIMLNDGTERCSEQVIIGTDKTAYKNLSTIKTSFKKDPDRNNVWVREYNENFFEIAEFQKKNDLYSIRISLINRNKR